MTGIEKTRKQPGTRAKGASPIARLLLHPLLFAMVLSACSGSAALKGDSDLYEGLGGQPGITEIVDGLLVEISQDPRIAHHFADSNIVRLREKLIEQICAESGGPCRYSGDTMRASHAGHGYTRSDFNALVECLQRSMRAQRVPFLVQNRLLARLAPMHRDIVER